MNDPSFYITVEPIDPPMQMKLYNSYTVQFLVVNHTNDAVPIQIQFHTSTTNPTSSSVLSSSSSSSNHSNSNNSSIVITGPSYQNLGTILPQGGSTVTTISFIPIQIGLLDICGCSIMDIASGRTVIQPPLWTTFVTK